MQVFQVHVCLWGVLLGRLQAFDLMGYLRPVRGTADAVATECINARCAAGELYSAHDLGGGSERARTRLWLWAQKVQDDVLREAAQRGAGVLGKLQAEGGVHTRRWLCGV